MAKRKSRSIKRKTPVDAALEIARNAIPKKPVATKGKRTVPAALDWGNGIPLDKLAYLNDDEMALVQAKRLFKEPRSYDGIPAFPDPGDTAAGDPNDSDGPTYGGGGGSDSGAGGDGGMGSYNGGSDGGVGSGTGGGSDSGSGDGSPTSPGGVGGVQSSKDTGATSTSPSGTGSTSSGETKTTTTGPSTGPTDQPVRSETSYSQPATTAPVSSPTGSLQGPGGYDPTTTAPSTEATNAALTRIAEGSSVLSSPYSYDPGLQKIPDRVSPVSYSQQPTVDMPDTTGANSPFADPGVSQYDRAAYDTSPSPSQVAALNAANQAALDARYVGSDLSAPVPGSGLAPPSYSDPSMVGPAPRETSLISAREPTDYVAPATQQATLSQPAIPADYSNPPVYTPSSTGITPVYPGQQYDTTILKDVPYSNVPSDTGIRKTVNPYTSTGETVASATTPEMNAPVGYMPSDMRGNTRGISQLNGPNQGLGYNPATPSSTAPTVASTPPVTTANATNPYYSSAAQQAADVRRTIALAQGPADAPTEINIPGGDLSVSPAQQQAAIDNAVKIASSGPPTRGLLQPQGQSPDVVAAGVTPGETTGEFDYDPAKDPANYMQPISPGDESGPGYFTPEERQAYLASIQGTRSSERLPYYEPVAQRDDGDEKEPPHRRRPRRPAPYVYRDYMYTDYPDNLPPADPDIINFNNYNQNLNRGGRIGDSVDAALRIAKSKLL